MGGKKAGDKARGYENDSLLLLSLPAQSPYFPIALSLCAVDASIVYRYLVIAGNWLIAETRCISVHQGHPRRGSRSRIFIPFPSPCLRCSIRAQLIS